MLACGAECQPIEVIQELERFDSSTKPARVRTDVGIGFIKSLGNPQGAFTLTSELIAAELGRWFGLEIAPFAVINKCEISIPIGVGQDVFKPPLFFSLQVDGSPRDGSDTFLKRLHRPEDLSKLIVFDTWLRNADRYADGISNSDNLLYSPIANSKTYHIVPIDHSHCFINVDYQADLPATNEMVEDPDIYGFFPEFEAFIVADHVSSAVDKLATLTAAFVDECVNSIPQEWEFTQQHREWFAELICRRADFVAKTISPKLVPEPYFPGLGGVK